MNPERKSDHLDERLNGGRIMVIHSGRYYLVPVALAFIVVLTLVQAVFLVRLASSNHQILTSEIPTLTKNVEDRDRVIGGQQAEIGQAVAAIEKLAKQVRGLGGVPDPVVLKPSR